jgi:hypothetical protein
MKPIKVLKCDIGHADPPVIALTNIDRYCVALRSSDTRIRYRAATALPSTNPDLRPGTGHEESIVALAAIDRSGNPRFKYVPSLGPITSTNVFYTKMATTSIIRLPLP